MAVNVRALLRDMDKGIVDWLNSLSLQDQDGSNLTAYYSAWPRWRYQYHPDNGVEIDYDRIKKLPLVAVRRVNFEIDKSRYVFPSVGTRLTVSTIYNSDSENIRRQTVPHPLPINVEYEINVLDNFLNGQNGIIEDIVGAFDVNEIYLNINYFYHKLKFESIDDNSTAYELGDQERLFENTIRLTLEAKLVDPADLTDVSNIRQVTIATEIVRAYQDTVSQAWDDWVDASYPFSSSEASNGEIWVTYPTNG
jgi:hypothetical protein